MYIYLLEDEHGYYKIGITIDIKQRMKGLSTGSSSEHILISSFKTSHNRKLETALKNFYNHKNKKGEWFELSNDDVKNFENICIKLEHSFDILKELNNPFI